MAFRGVQYPRPGSYGLRTQADIVEGEEDLKFASVATNGIIDASGKLTSRKEFVLQTSGFSGTVENVYTHRPTDGTELVLSAAAGVIYSGITTLTSRYDYSATSTTLNSWAFASLSAKIYGFQAGISPFVLNETTFAPEAFTGAPWSASPNVVLAASGRLWAADDAAGSNSYTLWWSKLLDGKTWNAGDAGNLDVRNVWPGGQDSIVAVVLLQDRVIIFGRNNILLYTLPADRDPADMTLTDSITNVGCIARDSVILAGGDLYFLAHDGYYKIPRLAQVTSLMALVKVSQNVADDFVASLSGETLSKVRAGYNPTDNAVVLGLPVGNKTWCFHLDHMVPSGTDKDVRTVPAVTYWTNTSIPYRGFCYDKDGNWYTAMTNGVGKYTGYTPSSAGGNYDFDFDTLWNAMQDETRLKILKSFAMTVETAQAQTGTFRWRQDYIAGTSRTKSFTCDAVDFAENPGIGVVRGQLGGACNAAKFGCSATINGAAVTLHNMRIFATPGRTNIR